MPDSSVTRHSGDSLPSLMDFFISPPTEIGKIISAETNIKLTEPHPSPIFNCTVLAIASIIAAIMGDVLICLAGGNKEPQARGIVSGSCAALVTYIGFVYYPLFPYCSYVGEDGIAEFRQFGSSIQKASRTILKFRNVTDLFHQQIISYYNGFYSGTSYTYTWKNIDRQIVNFHGFYYSHNKPPKPQSNWHFFNSAELAWTQHLWQKSERLFQQLGYVEFDVSLMLSKTLKIRIGEGWVEFLLKGGLVNRFTVAEMKEISLNNGMFQFTHQDAKWFSSNGKFAFNYCGLANARLFLICMERIAYKNFANRT